MTISKPVIFWLLFLVGFVVFLTVLGPILLPFLVGMALAYLLDPLADRIQRLGCNRLAATMIIMVLFALAAVLGFVLVLPIAAHQVSNLIANFPSYLERLDTIIDSILGSSFAARLGVNQETIQSSLSSFFADGATWLSSFAKSVWSGGLAFINVISLLVIAPVVAFYLLYDWDRMIGKVDSWLPRDHAETIRSLAHEMDRVIARFVRGQVLVGVILGTFYATGLVILGVNFGFLIGLLAGLVSFIPYLGTIFGFVASVGIALLQFWPDLIWPVATAGLFIAGQLIEGYILQPFLIGNSVGLHPVWLMFALLAFGYLFGFPGLLVAIPVSAAIGVLVRYAISRYLESPIYKGSSGDGPSA